MKRNLITKLFSFLVLTSLVLIIGCDNGSEDVQDPQLVQENISLAKFTSEPIEGQYIVVFKKDFKTKSSTLTNLNYDEKISRIKMEIAQSFSKAGITSENIKNTFGYALSGFAAKLSKNQLTELKNDARVKIVEKDQMITLSPINVYKGKPGSGGGGGSAAQTVPWGINRVGGPVSASGSTAWIIDSGIDLDHPDLNVDVARSVSFVRGDANDQNGHGTHVAGTVAALDNAIGVVGVAPGAKVVAVRVLDRRGSGSISGVIAGVDYVAANGKGDVANMSLGGGVSTALDDAVIAAAAGGVKFALAAGNESDNANNHSPARANGINIYTVSAMDVNDNFASFSNYGNPPIEYCAPGVSVNSTWKDGGYNTISGTSMAAPHVCGLLLLGNVTKDGTVNGDPDGNSDDIAHN